MAYTGTNIGAATTIANYGTIAANQMADVDKVLYLLKPYQTPLTQWLYFSQKNKAQKIINETGKFSWMEDELFPHQTTVSSISGGSSSENNIGVGDGTIFNEGDICLIEATEEVVYVSSTASSQVDITHIDGSSNITAASSGYIKIIGSRNHEFATARDAASTVETEVYNYAQIYSETVTTSGRYQAGDKYTNGKSHKAQVTKKVEEMKLQVERNMWFSTARGYSTVSTRYRHTYGYGALGMITTNATSYLGQLTEAGLDAYLKTVFAKGSNVKRHYAGAQQILEINQLVKERFEVINTDNKTEYGIHLTVYRTPFGILKLIWNPVFDGKFDNYGFTLDEEHCKLRYMDADEKGSRKFRIEENVETPGTDGKSTKILMDLGLQIPNEETAGILYKA